MKRGRPRRDTNISPYVDIRLRLSKDAYDKIQYEKSLTPNIPLGELASSRILGCAKNKLIEMKNCKMISNIIFGLNKTYLIKILEQIAICLEYNLHFEDEDVFVDDTNHILKIDMIGTPFSVNNSDFYSNSIISVGSSWEPTDDIVNFIKTNNCDFVLVENEEDGTLEIHQIFSIVGSAPDIILQNYIEDMFFRLKTIMPDGRPLNNEP